MVRLSYNDLVKSTTLRDSILKLSSNERAELLAVIWDSFFTDDNADVPLSDWQKAEIKRRDAELDANPDAAVSLDEVRKTLKAVTFKGRA